MKNSICLMFACAAALCGCMVGPEYRSPAKDAAKNELSEPDFANFDASLFKEASPSDQTPRSDWWKLFNDPVLDKLMEMCRKSNPDLKSLFWRVEQAKANACIGKSYLFPQIGGGADYFRMGASENGMLRYFGTFDDWLMGAGLTWDADLFGRVRSMVASERATAAAAQAQYENMLLALHARVASAYFTLREFETEYAILEKAVLARTGEREFIEKRVKLRAAPEGDLRRALEQEFSAKEQLTALDQNRKVARNYLANLLGTSAGKLDVEITPLNSEPDFKLPHSVPSTLLESRPDIAAAERAVEAANYKIGAAQAAFFPTVSITSAVGVESNAFSKLLDSSSFGWGISPQVYIPLFQAGRLVAQKRVALAMHKETVEKYKSTVLNALREVEDALANCSHLKVRYAQRLAAADSAKAVEEITLNQYRAGAADYFAASQAKRYALMNELAAVRINGEQYRARVDLIRALGRGWTAEELENTPE